jgi:uncharacterized repeat protein (TIGR03847 family)
LESPVSEDFRVGVISLAWLSDRNMVAIELHAVNEEDSDIIEISEKDPLESADMMRVVLTPAQTEMFIHRALAVVSAGRPPCPFCGLSLDPRGHLCPRANGYKR